jgi:endonuclease VIII
MTTAMTTAMTTTAGSTRRAMPEGDTIFRAARTLDRALAGKPIVRFESVFAQLNRVDVDAPIAGRTLERAFARGKHLLVQLSGELYLRTHMRMSGSWHIYRSGERWQRPRSQMRIVLETADFQAVAFSLHDAEWLSERQLGRSVLAELGSDLLGDFDPDAAVRSMQARPDEPIGDVILNQRVLAGIGNVYKSELLFLSGIHPRTRVGALEHDQLRALAILARDQLRDNAQEHAGAAIVTYRGLRRTTGRSDPSERLWVYGRAGLPCRRCGTAIESGLLGKDVRRTFHCPSCQHRPNAP